MLTTSPADGEALSAIRKANGMLQAARLSWEEFLKAPARPGPAPFSGFHYEPPPKRKPNYSDDVGHMASECLAKMPPHSRVRPFVQAMFDRFEDGLGFTKAQRDGVYNIWIRLNR